MSIFKLNDESVYYIESKHRQRFYVYWSLGNTCTYKCSYCPSMFHDGSVKYQPIDVIQRTIDKLSKMPMETHIKFTGGEPTFHPEFERIVNEVPSNIQLSVISNGSRPYPFWQRIIDNLHAVTLTFHSEFADLSRFLKTAKLIYHDKKKIGSINLTMIPNKWDECITAYHELLNNNISVNIKPLVENFGSKTSKLLSTYTKDQLKWINDNIEISTSKTIGFYNKDNVKIHSTSPAELLSLQQNDFTGWTCYNQTKHLDIGWTGNMFDSMCAQRRKVGSIYTDFEITTEPVLCVTNQCWSLSDLETKKIKNL